MHTRTRPLPIKGNDSRILHLACGTYRLPNMQVCVQINNMFARNKATLDLADQNDPIAMVVKTEMVAALLGVSWFNEHLALDANWRDYGDWREYGSDVANELTDHFDSALLGSDFEALWEKVRSLFITEAEVTEAEGFTEAS